MASSTLLNAAIMGDINAITSLINNLSAYELLQLRIPNIRNTILHLASEFGSIQAVKAILSKQSLLLGKFNSDGNTALHLAAQGGHVDIVSALIECTKNLDVRQKCLQLPEASYYQQIHNVIVRGIIIRENKRVIQDTKKGQLEPWRALLQWRNLDGNAAIDVATIYNRIQVVTVLLNQGMTFFVAGFEDPLYIAASRGFDDLVDAIIKGSTCNWSSSSDWSERRTPLHGAVICNNKNCTTLLLTWNKSLAARKDQYSQTALHYAAQLGFVDIVRELINVDASLAYITNEKGENVLHVAARHQQKDIIEYLLEECPSLVNNLVTKKDKEGNSPLHVLVASKCFVPKLIHHPMADKAALNNKVMTPLELVMKDNDIRVSMTEIKNKIAEELRCAGAMMHMQKDPVSVDIDQAEAEEIARVKRMLDNHMIVAALIATVAFTAGFAMPGGYIQNGSPNQGMAVLSRNSTAFQAFVISDAVALLFSTSALFLYFSSSLSDIMGEQSDKIAKRFLVGICLNMVGVGAIIVAFITGTYAVLQYSYTLAIVTSMIASSILLLHFIILKPLVLNCFSYQSPKLQNWLLHFKRFQRITKSSSFFRILLPSNCTWKLCNPV